MSVTFIVPTIGRESLFKTLASIETWPGDEIIMVSDGYRIHDPENRINFVDCPPGKDWGHTERNFATPFAKGQYIAHIDDDDIYAPGTRQMMEEIISNHPGKPALFRMQFPNGITLWENKEIRCGNVGTPMFFIPNEPEKLGRWESFVGGDCRFLETSAWQADEYVWRPEIIALLGHNT